MFGMILVFALMYLVSFGFGEALMQKLSMDEFVFNASFGFVLLIALLQIGYFPVQFFNLNFIFIVIWSLIVLSVGVGFTIVYRRALIRHFQNRRFLYIAGASIVFLVVFYFMTIDIGFSDSPMYLNYIAQNINNEHINLFNLYSGLEGSEWDTLYLYQGYYHFASFIVWLINIPHYIFGSTMTMDTLPIVIWGMGWLYQVVSTGFILDMIDDFNISNTFYRRILTLFTIGFTNFYYWKVAFAFYGNTFRSLLIWVLLFLLYRYVKSNYEKNYIPLVWIVLFAGCASSSSFFFISFEVMFGFLCYLIYVKKTEWIKSMANLVLPIVVYACVYLYKNNAFIGISIGILALIYYSKRNQKWLKPSLNWIERLITNHRNFWFILLLFVVYGGSFIYQSTHPDYLYDMAYWAQNHTNYDMVKDYRFIYSGWIDNILNVIRWCGLIVWLFTRRSEGTKAIKIILVVTMVVFLSPFSVVFISRYLTGNVFYRAIEIVFNPLTETMFIISLVDLIKVKWFRPTLCTVLMVLTIYAHVGSFINDDNGLYAWHITEGKDVNHIYKIPDSDIDIIRRFSGVLDENGERNRNDQITVISQVDGVRVFEPQIYQLFTARDYFYPSVRVDDTFYQMATNHYDWITYPDDLPYENVCDYFYQYGVEYIIVKSEPYYQNYQFDQASDACAVVQTSNDMYKIKRVVRG